MSLPIPEEISKRQERRERIAIAAMQAMIALQTANDVMEYRHAPDVRQRIAIAAALQADALLNELDK